MKDELAKLIEAVKDQGVDRGREAAAGIVSGAKSDAAKIVDEARSEAERIVEEAHKKSAEMMHNLDRQMSLAMRDLILKAKNDLEDLVALGPVRRRVKDAVSDPEFIKKLIFRIVSDYAKHRMAQDQKQLHIVIPEDMKEQFMKEWLGMLHSDLDVHATLHAEKRLNGFKLFREGGGGELIVDADSMVEVMRPFVSDRFRRILDEQAKAVD